MQKLTEAAARGATGPLTGTIVELSKRLDERNNENRTHLALDKDAPLPRPVMAYGRIAAIPFWADCIINIAGFEFPTATAVRTHA